MDQLNEGVTLFSTSAQFQLPGVIHRKPSLILPEEFRADELLVHPGGNSSLILNATVDGDQVWPFIFPSIKPNCMVGQLLFIVSSSDGRKQSNRSHC